MESEWAAFVPGRAAATPAEGNALKTCAPSSRNRIPIAAKLLPILNDSNVCAVLEVGAGTGQHAAHLAARLPSLTVSGWQPTDLNKEQSGDTQTANEQASTISAWRSFPDDLDPFDDLEIVEEERVPDLDLAHERRANRMRAIADWLPLDVSNQLWYEERPAVLCSERAGDRGFEIFTANTLHIMPWKSVETFVRGWGRALKEGCRAIVYGPFNYGGKFTSSGNEEFSAWLGRTYEGGGIRNFEDVDNLARESGCELEHDFEMPANNRLLIWKKKSIEGTT